jgi:integrase/recombinase XerD
LYTAKTGVPVYTILPDSVVRALEATPRVTETRFCWSGQGKRQTAVCDWQAKIKEVFDLAGIAKGLSNTVSHRLRDTFAAELLLAGVPIERLAMLLGHQSIRITEKHYAPRTRSRQEQIESDLTAAWKTVRMLSKKACTKGVQIQKGPVN